MADTPVLIVGAGPTGLVLALWLARLGVRPRIIDKTSEPGTTSRALAVQGRTLEFYGQIGLADEVVARGRTVLSVNLWVSGKKKAHAVLGEMGAGLSPYSYALVFPQDEHERLLIDRLKELGIEIERQTELTGYELTDDQVIARLKRPDGTAEECRALYLAGCDGAHSVVRHGLGIGFPGGAYEHLFYVADVEASGPVMDGELHVGLDRSDFLAVFPLKRDGHARLVGTVRDTAAADSNKLTWDDVSQRVIAWMKITVGKMNWFSTYHVHHRVAGQFGRGRAFLLGDSAHIHSPVGGQGMNTGIGDAVNLAWKLAAVVQGRAHPRVLDTYEPERIAFARRLIATTDQGFTGVTSSSLMARIIRLYIVPLVFPALFATDAMRRLLFRTVSQIAVNYRHSALSATTSTSGVAPGDRLPWIRSATADGRDNFAPLASLDWQVHVYGEPAAELQEVCERRRVPPHLYSWQPEMDRAGLARDTAYLIRPDGYIALAISGGGVAGELEQYLDTWGFKSRATKSG